MSTGATAWGDYNNDGLSDLFGGNMVWTNNGNGTFTTSTPFEGMGYVSLGDYNNDGYLDVVSLPSASVPRLYTNNGDETWTNDSAKFADGSNPWNVAGTTWGDFNGDGYLDTYWTGWYLGNSLDNDVIYMSNGGMSFEHTWTAPTRHGKGVTICDFDEDADIDIYVSNYWLNYCFLWRNDGFDGNTGLTDVRSTYGADDGPGHTQGSTFGDFDNDGDFDIFVSNFAHPEEHPAGPNPEARFLEDQGDPCYYFTDKGLCGVTQREPISASTTGDFNNDGYLDLVITVSSGYSWTTVMVYTNDGDFTFTEVTGDVGLDGLGPDDEAAFGDYDNDGWLDLLVANTLYHNPGGSYHWLKVKLIGGPHADGLVNGSAIGAQVRIDVPGLGTLTRQVEGNVGAWGMQNDQVLHFGLRGHTGPVDLEIFWPNGYQETIYDVAVDQAIVVPLGGPRDCCEVIVSSTEIWDGGQMHGITPSGSGTPGDPYVYVIPDGMSFTGSGVIRMNAKYVTFDFSSGTGGLDMASSSYFDLTGNGRLGDPGTCRIVLGDNNLTGAGDFKTTDIYKDSMYLTIIGSGDVSVNSFYMRTNDAFAGFVEIDIGGSVSVGSIDTQDQASGGNNGGDVTIRGADITIGDIDTRALRTASSDRSSGDVLIEALDPAGTNTLYNSINLYGTINTDATTGNDGTVLIRGVVVTLESGFSAVTGDGLLDIYAGMVQYGKPAGELFVDDSGGGYSAIHNVPWTTAGGIFNASNPSPRFYASNVDPNVVLSWSPGICSIGHDVYLGTDFNDVNDASDPNILPGRGRQEPNSYAPDGLLELGGRYFWRIDDVFCTGDGTTYKGVIWSFRTALVKIVGHSIVYGAPDQFCGWPANNGVWIWGNEILVGFVYGPYVEQGGHNLGSPSYTALGRSLDGGLTWSFEDPDNFVGDGGTAVPSPGGINFAHPDFALRTFGSTSKGQFFFSYDRGHSWQGPYTCGNLMSHPELSGLENSSRTDYIVNGQDDCLIGMSALGCGPTDRAFMARTTDGGATFNFVSWINPELCTTRGVMPSTVRISENKLITTLRRKYPGEWIDAFVSYDNGNSWLFLSQVADTYTWNGNPPALVRLRDGRLCCAYGNRLDRRIEARISEDEGATWSEEIILRDDYQVDAYGDPDLGYCRMVQRPDGKLVTMYYWATPEHPTHHIAATIWEPGTTVDLVGQAWNPSPADGANDVPPNVVLSWNPGDYAADPNAHDLYFGTSWDDVNDANESSPEYKGSQNLEANSYDAGGLELDTTYYWRIDEVNGLNTWAGDVWSFTTANYILIDDMESYNNTDNLISQTWLHGSTGALLGLGIGPNEPVHSGEQSMKYTYWNGFDFGAGYYSEIEQQYPDPCNWTALGVEALTLYFYGNPNNDAGDTEQMYVALKDGDGNYAEVRYGDGEDEDMNDVKIAAWQEWNIDLQDFNNGGVDLTDVNTVYIGFGDRDNWLIPGGTGTVYFDDIHLYPPRCILSLRSEELAVVDLSNNCIVDFADVDVMAGQWLQSGQNTADVYEDSIVNLKDFAVLANSWFQKQLWPVEE
jgi:hypothetical protein